MGALSVILDIILILISIVLIIAVLMQEGQKQGLGAIAGGADTFFGKGKAKGIDAKLAKITKIAAIVFIVLAIATTIVVSHNAKTDITPADLLTEEVPAEEVVEEAAEEAEEAVEEAAEEVEAAAEEVEEAVEEAASN